MAEEQHALLFNLNKERNFITDKLRNATLYIKLLHGRDNPDQQMDGCGFDEPVLGPFEAVHFTYRTHIRCFPTHGEGDELGLWFHDDMLVWQGKYYGDFEIATAFPAIAG